MIKSTVNEERDVGDRSEERPNLIMVDDRILAGVKLCQKSETMGSNLVDLIVLLALLPRLFLVELLDVAVIVGKVFVVAVIDGKSVEDGFAVLDVPTNNLVIYSQLAHEESDTKTRRLLICVGVFRLLYGVENAITHADLGCYNQFKFLVVDSNALIFHDVSVEAGECVDDVGTDEAVA